DITVLFSRGEGSLTCVQVHIRQQLPLQIQPGQNVALSFEDQNFPNVRGVNELVLLQKTVNLQLLNVRNQDNNVQEQQKTWRSSSPDIQFAFRISEPAAQLAADFSELQAVAPAVFIPVYPLEMEDDGSYRSEERRVG